MAERFRALPRWLQTALAVLAVVAGVLAVTQIALPGDHPGAPRGAPLAVLFQGVVFGFVNALTAAAVVLVYRSIRVVNFAQTALGAAGATLCFELVRWTRTPFPVALVLGVVLAAATGLVFELVVGRRFASAPRLLYTVTTVVAGAGVAALSFNVRRLAIFPKLEERSYTDAVGLAELRRRLPFPGFKFTVGSLKVPFGFPELAAIEIAVVCLLALWLFLRFTKTGVAVRALSQNADRAALLGMSTTLLSTTVWVVSGALSGASVSLTGFLTNPAVATGFAPEILLIALAAAVIGGMRNLPVTVGAAVALSVLSAATRFTLPNDQGLVDVGLFVVITIGLLVRPRRILRADEGSTASWRMTEEQRPIPTELRSLGTIRLAKAGLAAVGIAAVVLYPFLVGARLVNLGGVIALSSVVILSLVVLTGWAGQASLGQYAFAAVGAVVAGSLTARVGLTFWLAVPIAAAVTAGFAALVGLPALRIKGLYLLVSTFALAFAVHAVLFDRRYFGWLLPREIQRPTLFFVDFSDERSMYFLCVAVLLLALVVVANLRRSRFGRLLIAVRDSEANVQAFGVSPVRLKLTAFAVSGALAGLAGAVFAHQQRGVSVQSFGADASLNIFVLAVFGGITSSTGAMLGSLYGNLVRYFLASNVVVSALLSFGGTLLVLYVAPGGFVAIVTRMRDAVLRIIAHRRQIVVPSLFADYDADALAARLVPLAEPLAGSGLEALPADRRFAMRSELYGHEAGSQPSPVAQETGA